MCRNTWSELYDKKLCNLEIENTIKEKKEVKLV